MTLEFKIAYPDTFPDATQRTKAEFEQEARGAMAVKLFEMRRLSSGMAAILAGVSRVDFLLKLDDYGVALIDLSEEELMDDLKNA